MHDNNAKIERGGMEVCFVKFLDYMRKDQYHLMVTVKLQVYTTKPESPTRIIQGRSSVIILNDIALNFITYGGV